MSTGTLSRLTQGRLNYLRRVGVDVRELGKIRNRANLAEPATQAEIDAIPLPTNDAELAEFWGTKSAHRDLVAKHPDNIAKFTARYARKVQGEGTELQRQIDDAVKVALFNHMKEWTGDDRRALDKMREDGRLNLSPQDQVQRKYAAAYNKRADGAVLDHEFEDLADFAGTFYWNQANAERRAKRARIENAYGSLVPADGGFLIPERLRAELLRVSLESAVVRRRARVIPMDSLRVPIPMIDSTTNNGSVYGGMIGYWTEESAALVESQAKFGRIMLEANKLTGFAIVPNELLQDSLLSFAALIDQLWPEAIAFFEDLGFIRGSGAGEPLGWLGNPAAVAVSKESGQAAATIYWENIVKMYARMLPSSLNRAVWYVTPEAFPELATMALNVGTGGSAIWLNNGVSGPPATILGRPVEITEKMQVLGTQGDITFTDLGYYLIGDRQAMSAESSREYRFGHDQTAYRIIQRVTGRPWLQNAMTPANGGPTLSPFVELATRS